MTFATITLLTTLLAASPCPTGKVKLTYDHGYKDTRTLCFKAQGKTLKGQRQGKWIFTSTLLGDPIGDPLTIVGHYRSGKRHGVWTTTLRYEDGGCEVPEYLFQKIALGHYVKGLKQGKWRFERGYPYTSTVRHATYRKGRIYGRVKVKRWKPYKD